MQGSSATTRLRKVDATRLHVTGDRRIPLHEWQPNIQTLLVLECRKLNYLFL